MTAKDIRINAKSSTVTVEPSGARSVNLGQVLKSDRGRAQLEQIQKIRDKQVNRGQENNANKR
ncbi:MAG: hypothetical protein HYX63_20645 [Gammaproteobacteria bacterium]|nr:hypothetical protein [Gammaproteobacteria bacterium]